MSEKTMRVSFIGLGNMASAIIRGMVASGEFRPGQILGCAPRRAAPRSIEKDAGIRVCSEPAEAVEADVIILAVKPQVLPKVLNDLTGHGERAAAEGMKFSGKLFISIAAGRSLEWLRERLGPEAAITRVMPNINSKVGASTSAYAADAGIAGAHKKTVERIFSTVGSVTEIPEAHFSIFSAVAGASPAFSYMYIDALARSAVKAGLPRAQAIKIAAGAVLGSAKMILESDEHPCHLADQVCSPGGSTIEGVMTLQKLGFESAVHQAVQAVTDKEKNMG